MLFAINVNEILSIDYFYTFLYKVINESKNGSKCHRCRRRRRIRNASFNYLREHDIFGDSLSEAKLNAHPLTIIINIVVVTKIIIIRSTTRRLLNIANIYRLLVLLNPPIRSTNAFGLCHCPCQCHIFFRLQLTNTICFMHYITVQLSTAQRTFYTHVVSTQDFLCSFFNTLI